MVYILQWMSQRTFGKVNERSVFTLDLSIWICALYARTLLISSHSSDTLQILLLNMYILWSILVQYDRNKHRQDNL